ncbi:MAG: beta strand repeat-containing protein, partial [Dolichospermum sp.]
TTFSVTFTPTATGIRTATLSIANNDATGSENPYTIILTATGQAALAPEINIKQNTTDIASGGTYAFGNQISQTSSSAITFTIENTGNGDLTLTGSPLKIAISGTNAAEFSINETATSSTVASNGTTTFTVTFNPATVASKTALLTISNDDTNEGTYTINLTGAGTLSTQPTAAPTNMVFSSLSPTGFNVSFAEAVGNPTGYLVLRRTGSAPSGTPVDGTVYTVNQTNIGSGTNTVVYVGSLPSPHFTQTSLTAATNYFYEVFSYNGSGNNINYLTSTDLQGSRWTLASEPTAQGTPSISSITGNSMTVSGYGGGDGTAVMLVAKAGGPVDAVPVDGQTYTGSLTFGSGTDLGGGNFVITTGVTASATIIGLSNATSYHFAVFEYNGTLGTTSNFLTNNPGRANATTPSNSSDIIAVSSSESATISSLTNTTLISSSTDGTQVWQFTIRDGGGTNDADNLPTIINSLVFNQSAGNQIDNWSNAIQSAGIFNGTTLISNSATITGTQISFGSLNITVPDNGSLTISLRISVKQNVNAGASTGTNIDGESFGFQLLSANQILASATESSQFVSTFSPVATSSNSLNIYSVIATKLTFIQQPTNAFVDANMSPAVTVSADDAGGNRDINYTTNISITSSGSLSSSPIIGTTSAGLASFSNINHTAVGNALTLTASSGVLVSANSSTFNITSGPSTLSPGDIAIFSLGSSNPDKFSVILLKDINAETVIHFTDNGMASTTTGRTGEGFLTYTAPTNLCAGTILTWQNGQNITGTGWSSSAPTNFAIGNPDQLFAFQGSTSNWASQNGITLLYVIQVGGNSWITTGTATANNSYNPSSLDNSYKMLFSNSDVFFTSTTLSGSTTNIRTSILN